MRSELVYKAISAPDPVFVEEMMHMPDSRPEDEEMILKALPKLHIFFIQKKEAYKSRDAVRFQMILQKEIEFLRDFDLMAMKY